MREPDGTNHDDWADELDRLRQRYPSPVAFVYEWWRYNAPFIDHLRATVSPPARILEVGTGTGALSILLAAYGYQVIAIDKDPAIIESAKGLASNLRVSCRFEVADGFDLGRYSDQFDLAFSGGVLEHFERAEAIALLRQQALAATKVMALVPTWYALRNDPMTEPTHARRIWRPELERIFRGAGLRITRRFGYGVPGGALERIYRSILPGAAQWFVQNRLSYAATLGCIGERAQP